MSSLTTLISLPRSPTAPARTYELRPDLQCADPNDRASLAAQRGRGDRPGRCESYTVGDPFAEGTRLGPLVSAVQCERVRGYINKGIEEGAALVTGGPDAPEGLGRRFFVRPTVFSNVSRDTTIAQEEIFGPVLSIMPYDTEDEAVDIANDTVYGLAAGVSGSEERARRVARRIQAGQVRVKCRQTAQRGTLRRLHAIRPRPGVRPVRT